jgi:hypothetical protein
MNTEAVLWIRIRIRSDRHHFAGSGVGSASCRIGIILTIDQNYVLFLAFAHLYFC